jgi:transcriptional regulator with XRE-family HTH domain
MLTSIAMLSGQFARQIRSMREDVGLSQKQFGEEIGKPQSVISRLENIDHNGVTINTLLSLAKARNVGLNVEFTDYVNVIKEGMQQNEGKVETIYETCDRCSKGSIFETAGTAYVVVALNPEISVTIKGSGSQVNYRL